MGEVVGIYRYPVKGFSPEALEEADLKNGETIPFDRVYAIENGPGRFDPAAPRHLPKISFLMLMRDERLATLQTSFESTSETFTIARDGKQVARGRLSTPIGRQLIEQFIAAYMQAELRGPPKIVRAEGHSFSDVAAKCLHIVNLATVRDLERTVGRKVNPLRFRGNVYVDGLPAWSELRWVNNDVLIGSATLQIFKLTQRCEATNVDPVTGARDMAIPAALLRSRGKVDFGVYGRVVGEGRIATGSPVEARSNKGGADAG